MKKLGVLIGFLLGGIVIGAGAVVWLSRPARLDEDPQQPAKEPRQDVRDSPSGAARQDSASSEPAEEERTPFVNGTRVASA